MKKLLIPTLLCCSLLGRLPLPAQTTITAWTFENDGPTGFTPHPAPSTGSGTASAIGMDNSYLTPGTSTNISDIVASDAGSSDATSAFSWRVRGGKNTGTAANGWSTNAPIGTQGVEFDASTSGFDSIHVTFDVETTKAAEANLELEYTTDGSTWLNAVISYAGTQGTIKSNGPGDPLTVNGTYIQFSSASWVDGITADLSGIPSVNGDSNFGIRLVNASTGTDVINGNGAAYNNSSGNWRFDNVIISGTPIPEPSSLALAAIGLTGWFGWRRCKRAS